MPSEGKKHLLDCCYCVNEWNSSMKEPCKSCCYGGSQILRKEFEKGADREDER